MRFLCYVSRYFCIGAITSASMPHKFFFFVHRDDWIKAEVESPPKYRQINTDYSVFLVQSCESVLSAKQKEHFLFH